MAPYSITSSARASTRSGRLHCVRVGSVSAGAFRLSFSSQNDNGFPAGRCPVKTITALPANKLRKFLAKGFRRVFGHAQDDMAVRVGGLARSTIECLGRSEAHYHNFEH